MPEVRDARERELALDPTRSFLVQAPAGSGKTELLIQRYLVLLASVDEPESVVAITFTRKAAGEMRRRVLDALARAAGEKPEEPHKRRTWELAGAVRERDRRRGWAIAANPNRLAIRTIDSFCASITRRMPWLSRLGGQPELVEDAAELYAEAARKTIALVEDPVYGPPVARILSHLDNDFETFQGLLAGMLARRDQWLRHLAGVDPTAVRQVLEESLCRVIEEALAELGAVIPDWIAETLPALARHAAGRMADDHPIAACADLEAMPGSSPGDLSAWLALAWLLLTKDGSWRSPRGVNKNLGFPPEAKKEKQRFGELLEALGECDAFRARLADLRVLPPPVFEESQWEALAALIPVLQTAYGQLRLVFRAEGQTDFSEMALAALCALGTDDQPTDLAFAFDCRIRHLLIDEFQDTSMTQFDLIRRVTAGWTLGDGRTLFAVGDPMQSIYRFREAEVGLFLKAAREGVGSVRLTPLRLTTNFRSEAGLVEWVNSAFPRVLAPVDDIATGAVRFSPSSAIKAAGEEPVTVHPFLEGDDEGEANRTVEIVREARAASANARIAILVRARTHLPSILRALHRAGESYRAVEIDQLGDVAIIQDLLALTRALLHPADRVAWLAVMRAPWCGLTLAGLHALVSDAPRTPVWDLIQDDDRVDRLTADERRRLRVLRSVLSTALATPPGRLRSRVEGCWMALGGPACAATPTDIEHALVFFDLLDALDCGGVCDLDPLARKVDRLYAAPEAGADDSLQVMSIHKAKGLEFDVVIVPGLGRMVRGDEQRLLAWLEKPSMAGGSDLLLAPIKPTGAAADPLCAYVRWVEKRKTEHETGRLLYVAATRAKQRLHLLGQVIAKVDDHGSSVRPQAQSLLAQLWPAVEPSFACLAAAEAGGAPAAVPAATVAAPPIRRVSAEWQLPDPPPAARVVEALEPAGSVAERISYEWVGDTLRYIGTVVHRALQEVAREGSAAWDHARVEACRPAIRGALRALGVPGAELERAAAQVERAVVATLDDERGRWILDSRHGGAECEYAINGVIGGRAIAARLDRTFIDAEGNRWIVDFKTSSHEGSGHEGFLDNEMERYRERMLAYAGLFEKLDSRPVRAALYFPLLGGWREYTFATRA